MSETLSTDILDNGPTVLRNNVFPNTTPYNFFKYVDETPTSRYMVSSLEYSLLYEDFKKALSLIERGVKINSQFLFGYLKQQYDSMNRKLKYDTPLIKKQINLIRFLAENDIQYLSLAEFSQYIYTIQYYISNNSLYIETDIENYEELCEIWFSDKTIDYYKSNPISFDVYTSMSHFYHLESRFWSFSDRHFLLNLAFNLRYKHLYEQLQYEWKAQLENDIKINLERKMFATSPIVLQNSRDSRDEKNSKDFKNSSDSVESDERLTKLSCNIQ